jgi:hypothetical protein
MSYRYASIVPLLLLTVAAATGCGDSGKNAPPSTDMAAPEPDLPPLEPRDLSNTSPSCQVTLTGGATANNAGCTIQGTWTKADDNGSILLNGTDSMPRVDIVISRPGKPKTGDWKQSDTGAKASILVSSGLDGWSASVGGNSPDQGSYTLTLTDVNETVTTDDGSGFLVKGTLDATLPSSTGGATTVTLHATF